VETRQNDDGTPHMAYYDKSTLTSFIWDGKAAYIEVCVGGYGEPVVDTFQPFNLGLTPDKTAKSWLDWFEAQCLGYLILKRAEAANGGDTP
jgi:hypothetical protein